MAIITGNSRGNRLEGTADADTIFGLGGSDSLTGTGGTDVLWGDDDAGSAPFGFGDDRLDGGGSRDLLIGGAGADRLTGGIGDDVLIGGLATLARNDADAFTYAYAADADGGDDRYDGGAGFDLAVLVYTRAAAISLQLAASGTQTIRADGVAIGTVRGVEAIEALLGAGDDVVGGGANGDVLRGRGGDDTLAGGDGGDRIDGGAGNDRLSGGEGFDTLSYADATAGVRVDLGRSGEAQDTGGAGVDTFDGFEQLDGSAFSDRLAGSAGRDYVTGGAGGDDRLLGQGGDDVLTLFRFASPAPTRSVVEGGDGDDLITTGAAAGATDRITVSGGLGNDTAAVTVSARQTVDLGAGEDRVVLTLGEGEVTLTLGKGVDTVAFGATGGLPAVQTAAHVLDFVAGDDGDRIDLRDLLAQAAGYDPADNPFAAAFVRLVASTTGTALQFDADGAGASAGFATILELDGVRPDAFTAFNFGGTDPDGADPLWLGLPALHLPPGVHLA